MMSEEFLADRPTSWAALTLTVTVRGKEIRLATVTYDLEQQLYETFIGLPTEANQLGRIDASRDRAVRNAELRRLL